MFTQILSRQQFEKHRKLVLNLPSDSGVEVTRVPLLLGTPRPSTMGQARHEMGV